MSMKVTRLSTYWTPAQACEMLELLDELRDQLWATHADTIIAYRLNECTDRQIEEQQQNLELDDDPF